ncbi:MAG: tRNA (guanosine(46)-N7)-methyltransferase TrmB [Sulfurospirillaceae bacterium]|nr:tRNA (guanosine(46)-N7)-methyltransferase TrmB [Sulfurospirillaceae bacterium]
MPNFQTKVLCEPCYPAVFRETLFEFSAVAENGEKLIKVAMQGESFFIKVVQKKDKYLIKGDKITRPSQAGLLQRALVDFRDMTQSKEIFSNIEPKKSLHVKSYDQLKSIDYFAKDFVIDKEIWVEIGFGSGRHLLHQAKKNPDKLFIGLEIHKPSIEQVLNLCAIHGIDNVLVVDYDARLFLEFLSSNSVGRIFVHFPVPWDKKPHRRVISKEFIEESIRVLKLDGRVELRTDSDTYFEYSFGEFTKLNKMNLNVRKNANLEITSKYEDRWRKMDKDIYDIVFINEEVSPEKEKIKKLFFDKGCDFSKIKAHFDNQAIRGDGFFVHFEELYDINENSGFIKLSFGASERSERAYVFISGEKMSYFPDNILASNGNSKADNLIKEWIDGICS